ncbi:hypothetical protein KGM_212284A, partial [Danaus plexippus plexippus]
MNAVPTGNYKTPNID